MKILVTGSSGLIGGEAVLHFDSRGHAVVGVDNNMRMDFFGPAGDTRWNLRRLRAATRRFRHLDWDVRDRERMMTLFRQERFDVVIHCAAQPSHDRARDIPLTDFEVNALATVTLLETTRLYSPEAVFVLMSTNKVYGDAPNELPLVETETRWDYARPEDWHGISEECRIDRSLHSIFGASKVAADVMAQEYARYFGLRTGIFRGGCLTGPMHAGVQLHGFLSYLVKVAVAGERYTVFGYKGKQVRDQIHSADVVALFDEFIAAPRPGEVYNLGGGRENSASILECFAMVEARTGKNIEWEYVEEARRGDHVCYISDLRKIRRDFPDWRITRSLDNIVDEMVGADMAGRRV